MAANSKYPIAARMRDILRALPGAPAAAGVRVQQDDSIQSRADNPQWVVTMGDEEPFLDTTAGDDSGNGDVLKRYYFGVSMYYDYVGDLTDRLSTTPDLVIAAQQALNVKMPSLHVFGSQLVRFPAWERQELEEGSEVTRFLLVYSVAESRNG